MIAGFSAFSAFFPARRPGPARRPALPKTSLIVPDGKETRETRETRMRSAASGFSSGSRTSIIGARTSENIEPRASSAPRSYRDEAALCG